MTTSEKPPVLSKPKVSRWRRIGGGSLSVSLIIHGILFAIALLVIVKIIPPPDEKVVDFAPSGGGGSPKSATQQTKRATVMRNIATRISAKNTSSNFTLPEPEMSSEMSALGSLGGGGMGGMGGGGKGLGVGDGAGSGIGTGLGKSSSANPFGMTAAASGTAMIGTFYDLKQTNKGKPTGQTVEDSRRTIREFVDDGWKDKTFEGFYCAKRKLYQTKYYIPFMEANGAPAAFNCEKEVRPAQWVVIYRGTVTPPKTGKYRFAGIADDLMVVRFNGKYVFDYMDVTVKAGEKSIMGGENGRIPYKGMFRDAVTKGPEFRAVAGTPYPIEVMISELPGGLFAAMLLIEEVGEKYEKDENGSPILPLFRIDNGIPKVKKDSSQPPPPFDPNGPIWKVLETNKPAF